MRRILFLFLSLCAIAIDSKAQIKKGSTFLGGDINTTTDKMESVFIQDTYVGKTTGFAITPVFGKAIKDNLILGGSITATFYKNDDGFASSLYDTKSNGIGMGAFLRKYNNIGKSGLYFFMQSDLKWLHNKRNGFVNGNSDFTTISDEFQLSAYPGLSYAIARNFHIEAGLANFISIGYTRSTGSKTDNTIHTKTKDFNFESSLNNWSGLSLGIRFILGKK